MPFGRFVEKEIEPMSERRISNPFGTKSIGVPVAWGILSILLVIFASGLQAQRQQVIRQKEGGSASSNNRQAEILTQHVFRSRRQQVMLKRGLDALDAKQTSEGLTLLQRLLTQGEDGFIWLDDEQRLTSVRQEVIRRFDRFTPAEQKYYEQLFGSEAEILLEAANRQQDFRAYQELCRKYLHTLAGFHAANRLATKWLDQGRPLPAAQIWEHLYRTSAHRRRMTDMIRIKLMIAWRAVGDEEKVTEWRRRLEGKRTVSLGGREGTADEWLKKPVLTSYLSPRKSGAATADRHPSSKDARFSVASAPYWRPQWSHSFRIWKSTFGESLLSKWEQDQSSSLSPLSVSNFPLAVRGAIYIRSPQGVLAIDKRDGRLLWEYAAESSLSQLIGDRDEEGQGPQDRRSRSPLRSVQIDYAYANNSLMGTLTSDGERLYAVDGNRLKRYSHRQSGGANPQLLDDDHIAEIERRGINRLVALPLEPVGAPPATIDQPVQKIPLWSIGGQPRGTENAPLAGHFFLGPPVAMGGVLYVLAEVDRQINLIALAPETGDVLWSQGLCFVDNPIGIDSRRSLLSCTPIPAQGVLLCPTHLQSLIAVDAQSGSLLWAARLGDGSFEPDMNRWPNVSVSGSAIYPFVEKVIVDGHRILHLPHDSESISCLDLSTGNLIWQVPAEDTDYLAAIDRGVVLAVGRRFTRGLSLATGDELWSTWLGTPSGQGVQIGSSYLVPLERGRIANLDIINGREIGVSREESYQNVFDDSNAGPSNRRESAARKSLPWRPGNLIADGAQVISVGLRDVTAFPQAAARLKQVHEQLETQKNSTELELLTAELELTLGYFPEARQRLVRLLGSSRAKPLQSRIESSLRALLYAELKENDGDHGALLSQLSVLSHNPVEKARYLTYKAEADLKQGDMEGVLQACSEFAELDLPELIPSSENPEHWISAGSWIPGVIERVQQQIGSSDVDRLWTHIDEEQQTVLASHDVAALQNFLLVYAQWPQAAAVRLELAQRCFDRGDYQAAELYLLPARKSESPTVAAEATRLLFEIWTTAGLKHEAVDLLLELGTRYHDVTLADGQTGKAYAQRATRGPMAELAQRRVAVPWRVDRVNIRGTLSPDVMLTPGDDHQFTDSGPYLRLAYDKYRRRFPMPENSSLYLLDKGTNQGGQFAVINKHLGLIVGEIDVESNYNYSSAGSDCHIGHFFPLGTIGRMHGISLLEHQTGKPAWTVDLETQFGRNEVVRVGPVTPSHCIFQTRQALIAVDPASGKILWQRSDLLPTSGLTSDNSAGLIGDERVLVMFHADRKRYTVYETATGEVVRYGQLDIDSRHQRTVFGRKLFYLTGSDGEKKMRIWDPLTDRFDLEESVNDHHQSYQTGDNELLLINAANQLKIVDLHTAKVSLSMQLSTKQLTNLNYLRTFRDRDHYYINFQEAVRFLNTQQRTSFYATDTFLPPVHVQGTLWCVDRKTGEIAWERTLPQRTILQLDEYQLPFLVLMSKERGQSDSTRQSLSVEAIDIATGETIGRCENLFPDKMVKLKYDRNNGKLTLFGIKSEVELTFDRARQQVPSGDEPL